MHISMWHLANQLNMKKVRLFAIVVFLFIVLQSGVMASAWESIFAVDINKAYYTDIDDDGYEDDVFVKLKFKIDLNDIDIIFKYTITLTLPSGLAFEYFVYVSVSDESVVTVDNLFYNHATESGDYRVDVSAVLIKPIVDSAEASRVFDPPGSSDGLEPEFEAIVS